MPKYNKSLTGGGGKCRHEAIVGIWQESKKCLPDICTPLKNYRTFYSKQKNMIKNFTTGSFCQTPNPNICHTSLTIQSAHALIPKQLYTITDCSTALKCMEEALQQLK